MRWGTALHDRFMLPRFLWADFEDVIADLREAGMPLDAQWFAPHFEFRFPVLGAIEREGVASSCARRSSHGSCSASRADRGRRAVNSSLERVQVLVKAPAGDRYAIACNGYVVPLAATGVAGERVAGIRFRAWRTAEGFHPTIAPHVPLTFDIVDTWNGRSIGGCRSHVSRPDGRDPQTLPVNALEAEARRAALFEAIGHSPGGHALQDSGRASGFPAHPRPATEARGKSAPLTSLTAAGNVFACRARARPGNSPGPRARG